MTIELDVLHPKEGVELSPTLTIKWILLMKFNFNVYTLNNKNVNIKLNDSRLQIWLAKIVEPMRCRLTFLLHLQSAPLILVWENFVFYCMLSFYFWWLSFSTTYLTLIIVYIKVWQYVRIICCWNVWCLILDFVILTEYCIYCVLFSVEQVTP